jgi:hypothetical protein
MYAGHNSELRCEFVHFLANVSTRAHWLTYQAKESLECALRCAALCLGTEITEAVIAIQLEKTFFEKAGKLATPALHELYKRTVEHTCAQISLAAESTIAATSLKAEMGLSTSTKPTRS